jgi:hypothetical protein
MGWKLYLRNESYREPTETRTDYVSLTEALKGAYNLIIHPSLRKKPVLIEGPDGQRMEQDAIEAWCRDHPVRSAPAIERYERLFR